MTALMAATVVLAGCGNDTAGGGTRLAFDIARERLAAVRQNRSAADVPAAGGSTAAGRPGDPAQLASLIGALPGPTVLAVIESTGTVVLLGEFGTNGAYRTWATSDRRAVTFRNGVLVSTRGLGADLMSSDSTGVADLVRARHGGTVPRTLRYLNGEGQEGALLLTCAVVVGSAETITVGAASHATTRLAETCTAGGQTITNAYWVGADATVWQSRQYISPELGYATIQQLRL